MEHKNSHEASAGALPLSILDERVSLIAHRK